MPRSAHTLQKGVDSIMLSKISLSKLHSCSPHLYLSCNVYVQRSSMQPVKYEFAQHPPPDQTRNQTHEFLVTSPTPTSCPFGHESTCSNLNHMDIGRSRGKKMGVGGMCPHHTILFSHELCQKSEQRMNRSLVYEHLSHLL